MRKETLRGTINNALRNLTHSDALPVSNGASRTLEGLDVGSIIIIKDRFARPIDIPTDFGLAFRFNDPLHTNTPALFVSRWANLFTPEIVEIDLARTVSAAHQFFEGEDYAERYSNVYLHALVSQTEHVINENSPMTINDPRQASPDVLLRKVLTPHRDKGDTGFQDWQSVLEEKIYLEANPDKRDHFSALHSSPQFFVNLRARLGQFLFNTLESQSPRILNNLGPKRQRVMASLLLGCYLGTSITEN